MKYTELKAAMIDAGFAASAGEDFTAADQASARDFYYITGAKPEDFTDEARVQVDRTEEQEAEAQRLADERIAEEARAAEEARKAEEAKAEADRKAAEQQEAEAKRLADEAEAARKAAEQQEAERLAGNTADKDQE